MRLLITYLSFGSALLFGSCDSHPAAISSVKPPAQSIAPVVAVAQPDTADYTRGDYGGYTYHADTLILLGKQHYWLQTRQITDSTKPFDYAPAQVAGRYFAAPSDSTWQAQRVRGYEGTYTFTLRDSTRRHVLFSRQLHKKDLLPAGPAEIVTVSEPEFYYQGYSSGLNALLFTVEIGIPSSDVGYRAALLLDARTGRVRALHNAGSASFDAIDCDPQVSPTGQAILTCSNELLRAGRPSLSLRRPHAEIHFSRFLTDTTLLVVYTFGDYRPIKRDTEMRDSVSADPSMSAGFFVPNKEFVSTPAQSRAPNAFLYGTSGHVLSQFHYEGWEPGMGDVLPRYSSAATRTYYLVSESKDLVLLPKSHPGSVVKLPIKKLPKFSPPQHPQEFHFALYSDAGEYTFYVDKTNPQAIRYKLQPSIQ